MNLADLVAIEAITIALAALIIALCRKPKQSPVETALMRCQNICLKRRLREKKRDKATGQFTKSNI